LCDIGCAEGSITNIISKELRLRKENTYGIDIYEYEFSQKNYEKDNFQYIQIFEEKEMNLGYLEKIKSKTIDLVIASMSLHHIKYKDEMINEIYRILSPKNGLFVIREHDSCNKKYNMILDIMHGLYDIVWKKNDNDKSILSYNEFLNQYYAQFKSRKQWNTYICKRGFKLHIKGKENPSKNHCRYYHDSFKKVLSKTEDFEKEQFEKILNDEEEFTQEKNDAYQNYHNFKAKRKRS